MQKLCQNYATGEQSGYSNNFNQLPCKLMIYVDIVIALFVQYIPSYYSQ